MKIVEKIDRHEVLRRWAVGEVYSSFFKPLDESNRGQMLTMLLSGNKYLENQGIENVLELKQGLVDSISEHINWYRALLEINKSDLDMVYTLQLPGWKRNTNGSYLIADAANMIYEIPNLDLRVARIYKALMKREINMDGITLLAVDKIGPYVAIEGTGRLTSIYMAQKFEGMSIGENNMIEVTLGLY